MVLVSNEWQNKSENVPKTTANTTTATTGGTQAAAATATTSTPTTTTKIVETLPTAAATEGTGTVVNANSKSITTTNCTESKTVAGDSTATATIVNSINAITTESAIPETKTKTITLQTTATTNDNANNEQQLNEIIKDKNSIEIVLKHKINEEDDNINELKNTEVGKAQQQQQQQSQLQSQQQEDNNLKESVLNYNNKIKIMAENTKESPLKEEKESEDIGPEQTLITSTHIQEHIAGNNKDLEETLSYPNSNTNTLTITAPKSIIKTQQQQQQQQQQQVPLSCPITPQVLSSALQTALNNNNNNNNNNNSNMNNNANPNANNSVAAAGLQPNFLSQLALTANVAGLQTKSSTSSLPSTNNLSSSTSSTVVTNLTAKQLNQSFIMMEQTNNQTKPTDSNLLEGTTNNSSNNSTSSASTVPAVTYDNNGQAKIVLICEGNSHPFQTRTISLTPNVECMVGRLIAKSKASENNAIFDCKVLSRKHAVIWYTPDGKFWVKDTKSSNGTFINDNKLGDEEAELHFGDIVKFGVDVLENSRKEVHGCIIACVKLYLPDGREAISIDSSAHRSQYSGEGRISYDELHRLNLYIQETSQREKVLTSKLCNIQNVLDATRKNSALCWQSMITEDQLLHRIHSLEKKLQFMEKNVPENVLRNEVLKLLDDKSSYQHTAKEALRKVYQERCDAMQMLAKMESAYTQSDNECSLLRDQIMNSKQTLQEVNTRLLRLETEYNEYKDEVARQQQEAKEQEEQRIAELTEKLRERELECKELKKKISELLIKRAELIEDEEQLLEKQAIEKLDAAIADMDLGDDEDSSDDDDGNDGEENEVVNVEKRENKKNGGMEKIEAKDKSQHDDAKTDERDAGVEEIEDIKFLIKTKKHNRPQLAGIFGDKLNGVEEKPEQKLQEQDKNQLKNNKGTTSPPKRVKETTIMKWLQNSDLNKNEGSFDIFKAICNENEDEEGDEEEPHQDGDKPGETSALHNFSSKLKNVQKNLQQLEAEIENEGANINPAIKLECKEEEEDSSDEEEGGACAEQEFIIKRNGKSSSSSNSSKQVLSKDNKKYLLLKSSVDMLREAYNEIYHSVKERQEHEHIAEAGDKEKSPPPNIKVKTQFQAFATSPTAVANKKYHKTNQQQKLTPSSESDITESDSEIESVTLAEPAKAGDLQLQEKLKEYELQVSLLNEKLQQTELEAQHTLEIMQVECDDVKLKMQNLNKIIESLKNDKKALEEVINENNKNNTEKLQETDKTCPEIVRDVEMEKQLELEEDEVLKAINVTALEREEELITYKERLEEQQRENIDLRNEIALLKLKANNVNTTKDILLKQYLPCSFVVLAIIIYLLTTYY